jgi:hypothetical protein
MDGLAGKNSAEYWKTGKTVTPETKSVPYNIIKEQGKKQRLLRADKSIQANARASSIA